jgi:hypothetical protein
MAAGSERQREIRRRRKRRVKLSKIARKVAKASNNEKEQIVVKIRHMTSGHLDVLSNLGLKGGRS